MCRAALREQLAAEFALTTPELVHRERSIDGTEKFLLRLADGQRIESVFIPDTPVHDLLHLDPGGLRDGLRVLPHRQDGAHRAI